MTWARATRIFIFIVAIIVGLYDLLAAALGGADGTISLQLWKMTGADWRATTLVFILGYLAGHILGRVDK